MNILTRRRLRKRARDTLRYAQHVRNMREDLLAPSDLEQLSALRAVLREAGRAGDPRAVEAACVALEGALQRLMPARPHHGIRENLEIVVVALAVAMAFRTYFVQPFKIPTGSMEPTLYGIHVEEGARPGVTDRMPLKPVKWIFTGRWYREVRVTVPGEIRYRQPDSPDALTRAYDIGPRTYKLPKAAEPRYAPGEYVGAGAILWAGYVTTGDHVFVDRVRWNFARPRRGQIVVFGTDTIQGIPPNTHYIKRLVGLPGETISIDPPTVLADGEPIVAPKAIARIAARAPGYRRGYVPALPQPGDEAILVSPRSSLPLGPREYLVLGDNTGNSRDSRYWGAVPEDEFVGPAFMVYWPFSRRWGHMR
ncbi:MAG: signal peptidase I [Lentisphaerae bacterium]|nr:signal peptidase I [Lentisphaerota bacterium]